MCQCGEHILTKPQKCGMIYKESHGYGTFSEEDAEKYFNAEPFITSGPQHQKEVSHGTDREGRNKARTRKRELPDPLRRKLLEGLHEPVRRALRKGSPIGRDDADRIVLS